MMFLLFNVFFCSVSNHGRSYDDSDTEVCNNLLSPSSISKHIRSLSEHRGISISKKEVVKNILKLFDNGEVILVHLLNLIKEHKYDRMTLDYNFDLCNMSNKEIVESWKNNIDLFYYDETISEDIFCDKNKKLLIFDLDNTLYPYEIGGEVAKISRWYRNFSRRLKRSQVYDDPEPEATNPDAMSNKMETEKSQYRFDECQRKIRRICKSASGFSLDKNKCRDLKAKRYLLTIFKHIFGREVSLKEAHGILIYNLFKPNKQLRKVLKAIKHKKIIMTNGTLKHSLLTLINLQILDCFDAIFYKNPDANSIKKPSPLSYQSIIHRYKLYHPENYVFFDDKPRNLEEALRLGWTTMYIDGSEHIEDKLYSMVRSKSDGARNRTYK